MISPTANMTQNYRLAGNVTAALEPHEGQVRCPKHCHGRASHWKPIPAGFTRGIICVICGNSPEDDPREGHDEGCGWNRLPDEVCDCPSKPLVKVKAARDDYDRAAEAALAPPALTEEEVTADDIAAEAEAHQADLEAEAPPAIKLADLSLQELETLSQFSGITREMRQEVYDEIDRRDPHGTYAHEMGFAEEARAAASEPGYWHGAECRCYLCTGRY